MAGGRKPEGDMKAGMGAPGGEWHILNVREESSTREDCIRIVKSRFGSDTEGSGLQHTVEGVRKKK